MDERPNRLERLLLVAAFATAPFWFLHPPGINLDAALIFSTAATAAYSIRTSTLPLPPKRYIVGATLFLAAAAVAHVFAIDRAASAADLFQYVLTLVVVVPAGVIAGADRRTSWQTLGALSLALAATTVIAVVAAPPAARPVSLWWTNINQLSWLLAAAVPLTAAFALSTTLTARVRWGAVAVCSAATVLTVTQFAITGIIMAVAGLWVVLYIAIRRDDRGNRHLFFGASAVCGIAVVVVSAANLDIVIREGSVPSRAIHYTAVLNAVASSFPVGVGLGNAPHHLDVPNYIATTPHSAYLSYLLETGVVGFAGMLLVVSAWGRSALRAWRTVPLWAVGAVAVVAALWVIVAVQPAPVRRFWWLLVGWTFGVAVRTNTD